MLHDRLYLEHLISLGFSVVYPRLAAKARAVLSDPNSDELDVKDMIDRILRLRAESSHGIAENPVVILSPDELERIYDRTWPSLKDYLLETGVVEHVTSRKYRARTSLLPPGWETKKRALKSREVD